ncbi:MAG: hypothetical protein GC159_21400 [Phycisphaera sp.]|nr:hypothetical protein [Phycisphaera sp.]
MAKGAAIGFGFAVAVLLLTYAGAPSMPGPFEAGLQAVGVAVATGIGAAIGASAGRNRPKGDKKP